MEFDHTPPYRSTAMHGGKVPKLHDAVLIYTSLDMDQTTLYTM